MIQYKNTYMYYAYSVTDDSVTLNFVTFSGMSLSRTNTVLNSKKMNKQSPSTTSTGNAPTYLQFKFSSTMTILEVDRRHLGKNVIRAHNSSVF